MRIYHFWIWMCLHSDRIRLPWIQSESDSLTGLIILFHGLFKNKFAVLLDLCFVSFTWTQLVLTVVTGRGRLGWQSTVKRTDWSKLTGSVWGSHEKRKSTSLFFLSSGNLLTESYNYATLPVHSSISSIPLIQTRFCLV